MYKLDPVRLKELQDAISKKKGDCYQKEINAWLAYYEKTEEYAAIYNP